MARPAKEIDEKQIKALMRLKPTLADTAAFFECAERTIERFIREHFDLSFVEFRDQNMVHTRLNLIRKAVSKAESGDNTMLIFCLKNLCGWKDKQPEEVTQVIQSQSNETKVVSDDLILELLKKAREK
jgi:uncharacterized protein YbcV (DUF1398 family)